METSTWTVDVTITAKDDDTDTTTEALSFEITVAAETVAIPTIVTNVVTPATYVQNAASVTALSIDASTTNGALSYQWYSNTADSNATGTPMGSATTNTFIPPVEARGTFYYYCIVTNTFNTTSATATSNVATIIVIGHGAKAVFAAIQKEVTENPHEVSYGTSLEPSNVKTLLQDILDPIFAVEANGSSYEATVNGEPDRSSTAGDTSTWTVSVTIAATNHTSSVDTITQDLTFKIKVLPLLKSIVGNYYEPINNTTLGDKVNNILFMLDDTGKALLYLERESDPQINQLSNMDTVMENIIFENVVIGRVTAESTVVSEGVSYTVTITIDPTLKLTFDFATTTENTSVFSGTLTKGSLTTKTLALRAGKYSVETPVAGGGGTTTDFIQFDAAGNATVFIANKNYSTTMTATMGGTDTTFSSPVLLNPLGDTHTAVCTFLSDTELLCVVKNPGQTYGWLFNILTKE